MRVARPENKPSVLEEDDDLALLALARQHLLDGEGAGAADARYFANAVGPRVQDGEGLVAEALDYAVWRIPVRSPR